MGKRRRKNRNSATIFAETATEQSADSTDGDLIPGFYYDPVLRRHFRILPDQLGAGVSSCVTPASLKRKDLETKRQKRLEMPTKKSDKMSIDYSMSSLLSKRQLGLVNRNQFRRKFVEGRVRSGSGENFVQKFGPNFGNAGVGFDGVEKSFSLLLSSPDGNRIVGWSRPVASNLRGSFVFGIKTKSMMDDMDQHVLTENIRGFWWNDEITDMGQFLFAEDGDRVLYTIFASDNFRGALYLDKLWNLEGDDEEPKGIWNFDKPAWCCALDQNAKRAGVGLEGRAEFLFMETGVRRRLSTKDKDPMIMRFSQDGNLFFVGLRASDAICYDSRSRQPIFTWQQNSVCGLHLLSQDENYFVAGDFHGQIKLWDIRMIKAVRRFSGHINSHTKVPFMVNEDDSLIIAGGEDGTTRCWSLHSGDLLREISSPRAINDRRDLPAVCYSSCWGGIPGNAAVVLGVNDELHFVGIKR